MRRTQVTDVGEGGAVRCVTAAPDGTLAVQRNPRRLEFFEPRTRSLFVMVRRLCVLCRPSQGFPSSKHSLLASGRGIEVESKDAELHTSGVGLQHWLD